MSKDLDLTHFPTSPMKDAGGVALRVGASALPFMGGAAGALLDALMPEMTKDRVAWLEYLAQYVLSHGKRIDDLEAHDVHLNEEGLQELVEQPAFRAAVYRTADIALQDPLRKKWDMLCNVVLNASQPHPPDDDMQLMFLGFLREFGESHLRLLKLFNAPRSWPVEAGPLTNGDTLAKWERKVAFRDIVNEELPELAERQEFCQQCIADLITRGLITLDVEKLPFDLDASKLAEAPLGLLRGPLYIERVTTGLGFEFLRFITRPGAVVQ